MKRKKKTEYDPSEIIGYDGEYPECESFDHDGIEYVSDKAALLMVDGENQWVPKSQIVDATESIVKITSWMVKKLGW